MKTNLILTILLFIGFNVNANNLQISAGQRIGNNQVSFIISWENSWYAAGAPSNHDAVWIFIKYRECGSTGDYTHALLSTNMGLHTFSADITAATPVSLNDRFGNLPAGATETNGLGNNTGIMIRRSSWGEGNISNATCTLTLVSSAVTPFLAGTSYEIKVIGIEMVQVLEGQYYLGDNQQTTSSFNMKIIQSEDAISANYLLASHSALPAEYPKGFAGFYCMKYEITQGQYLKFADTGGGATTTEPSIYPGVNRNNFPAGTTPDRAQNFLNWGNLTAYLDWACLRPMTELEYEKACRGSSVTQIARCYAWGTTNYERLLYVSGPEDGTETAATTNANCHCYELFPTYFRPGAGYYPSAYASESNYSCSAGNCYFFSAISDPACTSSNPVYPGFSARNSYCGYQIYAGVLMCGSTYSGWGPVGAGIFARNATVETRETTGATYYGIMEMSGNVAEQCVDVTSTTYLGGWGNGYLNSSSEADVADWPVPTAARCLRGGGYALPAVNMRICDRQYNNNSSDARGPITANAWRQGTVGGRGVR